MIYSFLVGSRYQILMGAYKSVPINEGLSSFIDVFKYTSTVRGENYET